MNKYILIVILLVIMGCADYWECDGNMKVYHNTITGEWKIQEYGFPGSFWYDVDSWDIPFWVKTKSDACKYVAENNAAQAKKRKEYEAWKRYDCSGSRPPELRPPEVPR